MINGIASDFFDSFVGGEANLLSHFAAASPFVFSDLGPPF